MKSIGFEFQETLSGTYTLSGRTDPPQRFSYTATLSAPSALQHLRDHSMSLTGTLDMEGFADDVPIAGRVDLHLLTQRAFEYQFTFCDNQGQPCVFQGRRELRVDDLKDSLTTLLGVISRPGGGELARAKALFDVKSDLLPFLISWKPLGLASLAR